MRPLPGDVRLNPLRAGGLALLAVCLAGVAAWQWGASRTPRAQAAVVTRSADDPISLAQRLVAADAAIAADPASPDPQLERAIVLHRMGLFDAAATQFDRWAAVEPDAERLASFAATRASLRVPSQREAWIAAMPSLRTAAAQGNAHEVAAIVDRFPLEARLWAEGPFVTEWASAVEQGDDAGATAALALIRSVGQSLQDRSGDAFVPDVAASLETLDPSQRIAVAGAQKRYETARRIFAARDGATAAIPMFAETRTIFERAGSPLALVALHYHATALYDASEHERVLSLIDELRQRLPERYRARRAELAWLAGTAIGSRGELYQSLVSYREALQIFQALGETAREARLADLLAAALGLLGRDGEAVRMLQEAFRRASETGDLDTIEAALTAAAARAEDAKDHALARSFYRLALDHHAPNPNRVRRVHNLRGLAFAAARVGNAEESALAFERATAAAQALGDPHLRDDALDNIRITRALILRDDDPAAALQLLDESLAAARRKRPIRVPRLLVERARAARRLGRTGEAARDLTEAIATIEARRSEIAADQLRDSYLGSAGDAYDELFDLAEQAGDYDLAFRTSERQRGRLMHDRFGSGDQAAAQTLASVAGALPARTALVVYKALPDRLVIFVAGPHGVQHARAAVPRPRLEQEIDSYRTTLRDAANAVTAPVLASLLIQPVASALAAADEIVIVPDEIIGRVPFAALDTGSGTFAAQRWTVSVAPSAGEFLRTQLLPQTRIASGARACVVGDPAFDSVRYGSLPRLPAAAEEARHIAELYGARPVVGADATRSKFEEGFQSSDVVHVAAHALLQAAEPERSALLFADGELQISEISDESGAAASVVVLAGCRTAVRARRSELSSLANAFLAAGARSVLGTLWDLPDGESQDLVSGFHRRLLRGESPARALAETQRELIRAGARPSSWSAFQVHGSR